MFFLCFRSLKMSLFKKCYSMFFKEKNKWTILNCFNAYILTAYYYVPVIIIVSKDCLSQPIQHWTVICFLCFNVIIRLYDRGGKKHVACCFVQVCNDNGVDTGRNWTQTHQAHTTQNYINSDTFFILEELGILMLKV